MSDSEIQRAWVRNEVGSTRWCECCKPSTFIFLLGLASPLILATLSYIDSESANQIYFDFMVGIDGFMAIVGCFAIYFIYLLLIKLYCGYIIISFGFSFYFVFKTELYNHIQPIVFVVFWIHHLCLLIILIVYYLFVCKIIENNRSRHNKTVMQEEQQQQRTNDKQVLPTNQAPQNNSNRAINIALTINQPIMQQPQSQPQLESQGLYSNDTKFQEFEIPPVPIPNINMGGEKQLQNDNDITRMDSENMYTPEGALIQNQAEAAEAEGGGQTNAVAISPGKVDNDQRRRNTYQEQEEQKALHEIDIESQKKEVKSMTVPENILNSANNARNENQVSQALKANDIEHHFDTAAGHDIALNLLAHDSDGDVMEGYGKTQQNNTEYVDKGLID